MLTDLSQSAANTTVLAVRLGDDLYALPLECVEEVLPALPIESLPQCPDFLLGAVHLRQQWLPVLDTAKLLAVPRRRPLEPPIVCIGFDGHRFGIEVDEVIDPVDLASQSSVTADRFGAEPGFFKGIAQVEGRAIRILDLRHSRMQTLLQDSVVMP